MAINSIGGSAALTLQTIGDMRAQLDDLQRQLGSGKKATSYAGLGLERGLTIGLRSQLSAISGYQGSITQVGTRLNLMQTTLSEFDSVTQQSKSSILQSKFALNGTTQTQDQRNVKGVLDQLVGMLNTGADGRYLFSGRAVTQVPVETVDHILNGEGLKAGLKQIIDERGQADLGASGLGRVTVASSGPTSISITEDVGVFGFKLVGASTNTSGATVTGPSGTPPVLDFDFGATNPSAGDTVTFTFKLPDGSSRDLTLKASTSATPAAGEFTIGATTANTASNFQTAVTLSLGKLAGTELTAASAVAAGNDFFKTDASHPPQRVDGPPFDTATGMIDGTPANTVQWYMGDNGTDDPRSTAVARVDTALTVSYGARANENGLRVAIQSMAIFSAVNFTVSGPDGEAQYSALKQRIAGALTGSPNEQKLSDIAGQLAGSQVALANAKDRHEQTNTTLQNLLQSVEGAPTEEVAAQILTMQTSLQATLQTTAMLLRTNLLNYL
jgi:flagellin-like hook-associated protein FlgL